VSYLLVPARRTPRILSQVASLKIGHRYLFSCAEDGTVKIWRFRSTDALQTATLSYNEAVSSLCLLDTAKPGVPNDLTGLHAVAGLRDGNICVLPYSLKSQWLQGAMWQAKIKAQAFPGGEPVTALQFTHRLLRVAGAENYARRGTCPSGIATDTIKITS